MATVKKSSSAKLTQEAVVVKTTVTTVTKKQVKQPAGAGIGRLGYTVVLLSLLVPLVLWMRSPSEDAAVGVRRKARAPVPRVANIESPQLSRRATSPYTCNPETCVLPDCNCPSQVPPGNLTVENTPQFVLLTFDDAVQIITYPLAVNATAGTTNPNGCRMPATFFVSTQYTNYHMVQMLYKSGHEIACHTMTHVGNAMTPEINGSRAAINAFAGVPMSDLRGFRAPFLLYNLSTLETVHDLGFMYDLSNPVDPPGRMYWPYTLDNGWPVDCSTGDCGDYTMRFPGLWEISMNSLLDPATGYDYASMDPPGTADFLMTLLQYNFNLSWNYGRMPFGLWLHPAWFMDDPTTDRIAFLTSFYAWVKTYTNDQVWFVTATQLIEWTKNPIGLDQPEALAAMFACPWADPETAFNASTTAVEVCDGVDNNLNGRIDEGVLLTCNLGEYYSDTCFYCPVTEPNADDPVPVPIAGSGPVTASTCVNVIPVGGCVQGAWSATLCTCVCVGGGNQASNGFCTDATGACTILKTWDVTDKVFLCPGETITASSTATATVNPGSIPGSYNEGAAIAGLVVSSTSSVAATPTPCPAPSGGCVQGTWSATLCACVCVGGGNQASNGFCTDATGACTIVKTYDFTNRVYLCPGETVGGSSTSSISAVSSTVSTTSSVISSLILPTTTSIEPLLLSSSSIGSLILPSTSIGSLIVPIIEILLATSTSTFMDPAATVTVSASTTVSSTSLSSLTLSPDPATSSISSTASSASSTSSADSATSAISSTVSTVSSSPSTSSTDAATSAVSSTIPTSSTTATTITAPTPCSAPSGGGCQQGAWLTSSCRCVCIGAGNQASNGYCLDDDGACSIAKTWDQTDRAFLCPGEVASTSASSTGVTSAAGVGTSTSAARASSTSGTRTAAGVGAGTMDDSMGVISRASSTARPDWIVLVGLLAGAALLREVAI